MRFFGIFGKLLFIVGVFYTSSTTGSIVIDEFAFLTCAIYNSPIMVEANDRRIIIPESEIKKIDPELLSYAEHHFIGSGVTMNGASEAPLVPVSLIKKERSMAAVYHGRDEQHWITSNVADTELFGIVDAQRYSLVFRMADFDVMTGEITGLPKLHGVYDNQERTIIKDEEQLATLGISEERARDFAEAKIGHFFPNGAFVTKQTYS